MEKERRRKRGVRFWYPICGYNWGWCELETGCKPPSESLRLDPREDCPYRLVKHPLTGTQPYPNPRAGVQPHSW